MPHLPSRQARFNGGLRRWRTASLERRGCRAAMGRGLDLLLVLKPQLRPTHRVLSLQRAQRHATSHDARRWLCTHATWRRLRPDAAWGRLWRALPWPLWPRTPPSAQRWSAWGLALPQRPWHAIRLARPMPVLPMPQPRHWNAGGWHDASTSGRRRPDDPRGRLELRLVLKPHLCSTHGVLPLQRA